MAAVAAAEAEAVEERDAEAEEEDGGTDGSGRCCSDNGNTS